MADRQLSNALSSGELTNIQLGSTAPADKVQKKSDMASSNVSFDDTGLGITATTAQEALAELSEVGLVVMSGTDLIAQEIATTPTKVVLYDTKLVEAGVGAVGNVAENKAIATLDGIFKIRFEAFVSYASNVDITWILYRNGVPAGNEITLSGQGTTVFQIILLTSAPLVANDILELYATASATTDATMTSTNGTLEKTIF